MTVHYSLVLGGGGTVGMAYHAGVLRGLADAGLEPQHADLVVGTSAGAVMGAMMRTGHGVDDLWDFAMRTHPMFDDTAELDMASTVFFPGWRTPLGLARRMVGSAWVLNRSLIRWPPVQVPSFVARMYRGGLSSSSNLRTAIAGWTGEEWPSAPLWLTTVDIVSGARVVLGRRNATDIPLPDAVRASAAVPGLYPPVRYGQRVLVDGGAHSANNVDLATRGPGRPKLVVAVAPLSYDPTDPPGGFDELVRRIASRTLDTERELAERRGFEVLLIRPSAREVAEHGFRFMRPEGTEGVAELAAESTRRLLGTTQFAAALERAGA